LQEVPDGATMVGNPARQVGRRAAPSEARPAFQPYGIDPNIPDPIARALTGLLDEVQSLRARVAEAERVASERTSPIETVPAHRVAGAGNGCDADG
jgi:serine O-acetyltransferase